MKIVVLGATGKTGRHVVEQALAAGHSVVAFVRNPAKLHTEDDNLRIVAGDARSVVDLAKALKGQDAVISTIGSNKLGSDLIIASTKALSGAMHKTGVKRIIMMSSFLASPNFKRGAMARLARWLAKPIIKDKLSGEDLLKKSDLDWTIVYATRLDGKNPGGYRTVGAEEEVGANEAIARADVATCLLDQLNSKKSIKKSLVVTAIK